MKNDIIISGVGGQGILSIAATIGLAAIANDLYLKQSEVHGMSQRGGDVQSHLRLSDKPVSSDLIPYGKADLLISVVPMEDGWLVTNSTPFVNIPDYPDLENILAEIKNVKNNLIVDADQIAKECGGVRSGNMVILGAASHFIDMQAESLENAITELFARKGEAIVDLNIKAFRAGRKCSESFKI